MKVIHIRDFSARHSEEEEEDETRSEASNPGDSDKEITVIIEEDFTGRVLEWNS